MWHQDQHILLPILAPKHSLVWKGSEELVSPAIKWEKEDKVDKVDGDPKLDACNCTKVKKLASKWVKEKKSTAISGLRQQSLHIRTSTNMDCQKEMYLQSWMVIY